MVDASEDNRVLAKMYKFRMPILRSLSEENMTTITDEEIERIEKTIAGNPNAMSRSVVPRLLKAYKEQKESIEELGIMLHETREVLSKKNQEINHLKNYLNLKKAQETEMTDKEMAKVGKIALKLQKSIAVGLSGPALQLRLEQAIHVYAASVRKDQIEKDAKIVLAYIKMLIQDKRLAFYA